VAPLDPGPYLDFLAQRERASFLQTPAWAEVKPDWRGQRLGWYEAGRLVGVGSVLLRPIPKLGRSLAYLPEGPVLDWDAIDPAAYLRPLVRHLRDLGAFAVRIGPTVVRRRWLAPTIKAALADDTVESLSQVRPDQVEAAGERLVASLAESGWRCQLTESGFAAGQPAFNFQLPLAGRDEADLLAGMNQLWRRNIKKADQAGLTVRTGQSADLADFHRLYLETAARDGFRPRPLTYFETMWRALRAEDPDRIRLYLAEHEGDLVAGATWVKLGRQVWYSYGASATAKRQVRGSNAIQWRMMRDALAAGATVYDLRGITPGLGADDPEVGLIQFKVGTGGQAVEYVGEWDLVLNRPLYRAFQLYVDRAALAARLRGLPAALGRSLRRSHLARSGPPVQPAPASHPAPSDRPAPADAVPPDSSQSVAVRSGQSLSARRSARLAGDGRTEESVPLLGSEPEETGKRVRRTAPDAPLHPSQPPAPVGPSQPVESQAEADGEVGCAPVQGSEPLAGAVGAAEAGAGRTDESTPAPGSAPEEVV
jgi:lipid II:glycine glycyltransferase (peptidoglycan interpeptide bridge formation enzyme)